MFFQIFITTHLRYPLLIWVRYSIYLKALLINLIAQYRYFLMSAYAIITRFLAASFLTKEDFFLKKRPVARLTSFSSQRLKVTIK